ncbi:MAG: DUF4340 domain-containing protein, partial [Planctomycetaceae bacterium]|nr:DUF4340 domain-containing protein [Planctomycetaceae bacterium]
MTQPIRTLSFFALAVVSLGVAWAVHVRNQPKDLAEFSDVGTEFYPEFKDPNAATGLQVASYDEESGKTNVFKVEVRDGVWRIPSHLDYPADGKDRLAKTAASMLQVTRLALVEQSKAAHKRYKVLDPLDEEVDGTEGYGDRITLYQGDETVVDLIVGEKLEGQPDIYYVRQPGRDQVYTADLGTVQISTKFSDWIKTDLLELDRQDLASIIVDTYHIDEARGVLVPEEQFEVKKDDQSNWQLVDIDPTKEKLKTSEITSTISALDDLKIIGIRRKPASLASALKGEGGALDLAARVDMQEKGFFFDPGSRQILANEGNIIVGSSKGVAYVVKFGEEFSGDEVALEVGQEDAKAATDEQPKEDEKADATSEEKTAEEAPEEDDSTKGRYLFIGAVFHPDLLGPKPEPPVKPEPPAEKGDNAAADQPAADAADDEKKDDAAAPADAESKPPEDPKVAYEKALKDYELAQDVYEQRLKFYEEDLKKAQERADELDYRFADWYYVISDADY